MVKSSILRSHGFTLIEVLIAIVLLAILAGLTGPLLTVPVDAIGFIMHQINLDESANVAFSRMSREIRRLRDDESVVGANATQFEFIDISGTQIRYRIAGNTLLRRQNANPESGLADYLQDNGLSFIYYDDDGNGIATPTVGVGTATNIRGVRILATFQDANHLLPVEIQIRPRNLRHESERFF